MPPRFPQEGPRRGNRGRRVAPRPVGGQAAGGGQAVGGEPLAVTADDARAAQPAPGWRRTLAAARRFALLAVLVVCVAAVATGVAAVASGGWQVRPVLSGSMRPTFPVGGVVITESVPTGSLRVGDVAVFHPPGQADITYVHRIVWLHREGGQLLVQTKGDANPVRDPWTLHVRGPVAYRERWVLPLVGYAAVWVHSAAGRHDLYLVAVAAFVLCTVSLVAEQVRRSRPAVRRRQAGTSPPAR